MNRTSTGFQWLHLFWFSLGLALWLTAPLVGLGTEEPRDDPASEDSWLGSRVVLKRDAVLKVEREVVATAEVYRVFEVMREQDSWLWVVSERDGVKGWVKSDQVIPLERATAYYSNLINTRREPSWAHQMRGLTYAEFGLWDEAMLDFDRAVRRGRMQPSAYLNRALYWKEKGNLFRALEDLDRAVHLAPTNALTYYNRGLVWLDAGRVDYAFEDFERATQRDPANHLAWFNKAASALIAGEPGALEAAEAYVKLVGWNDPRAPYVVVLGVLGGRRSDQQDEANQLLDEALDQFDLYTWPTPILRYLDGQIDAPSLLNAAGDDSQRVEARLYAALDLVLKGREADAQPQLNWVAEHGTPGDIPAVLAQAELNRIRGDDESAEPNTNTEPAADPAHEPPGR